MQNTQKNSKIVFVSLALAVIFGGVAGAIGGIFVTSGQYNQYLGYLGVTPSKKQMVEQGKVITLGQESAVISVVEEVSPAVVSIVITKDIEVPNRSPQFPFDDYFFREFFGFDVPQVEEPTEPEILHQQVGSGSGFIVSKDGFIITNKHVVFDDEAEYSVIMNNGDEYQAEVLDRDPVNDIAVLKIEASDLPTVKFGNSGDLKVGQTVIAIGNALGEFSNTVSTGVISGLSRSIIASSQIGSEQLAELIQTDAAINQGNSGGPLLNILGEVIGINTAVSLGAQNIGFAIPVNEVISVYESVRETGEITRPWLGVRYVMINKSIAEGNNLDVDYGALVVRGDNPTQLAVIPGSPADKAGLEENDIILEINGQRLDSSYPLNVAIRKFRPGDIIELKVLHDGEENQYQASLEKFEK